MVGVGAEQERRWIIRTTGEVRAWLRGLRQADVDSYRSVNVAIDMLAEVGPGLGRPLVDTLHGSKISNLKELRPRSGRYWRLQSPCEAKGDCAGGR